MISDAISIERYLQHMCLHGKGDDTFSELERRFDISPFTEPGNRAKKLWYHFMTVGISVQEYIDLHVESASGGDKSNTQQEWIYENDVAHFRGTTDETIRTLDDALRLSQVDLNVWDVDRWQLKTWDVSAKVRSGDVIEIQKKTNYGVQVWFKKKANDGAVLEDITSLILDGFSKVNTLPLASSSRGVGVLNLADFHIGAEIVDLVKTPDFDVNILVNHLDRVAIQVNSLGFSELYVNLLGDYFESISGLNHLNTFKSIGRGMYGARVIKLGITVISEFLKKLNNLAAVNVLSGNHDRVTANNQIDTEGAAAEILAYGLSLIFGDAVVVDYHPYIMSKEIDDICYLLTHGHHSLDKRDPAKIIKQYGSADLYTIWLSGHIHSRKTDKFMARRPISYDTISAVSLDEMNYRKVVVPSLFTGNFYSETLGYTSCGGFIVVENNGFGKPNVYDYSI